MLFACMLFALTCAFSQVTQVIGVVTAEDDGLPITGASIRIEGTKLGTVTDVDGVLITPHLGASTKEAEDNCAVAAVKELRDFIENGNIKNSVNFPGCDMGICNSEGRVAICHKNIAGMITQFSKIFSDEGVNISDMTNKSKGAYAYTLIDLQSPTTEDMVKELSGVEGVLRVRVIK